MNKGTVTYLLLSRRVLRMASFSDLVPAVVNFAMSALVSVMCSSNLFCLAAKSILTVDGCRSEDGDSAA